MGCIEWGKATLAWMLGTSDVARVGSEIVWNLSWYSSLWDRRTP